MAKHFSPSNPLSSPQMQQLLDKIKSVVWEIPSSFISHRTSSKWDSFKHYVEQNRKWMRFCEDALTKISFFLPGRWGDSGEIGEFVYGLGLVLQTLNDRALDEESNVSLCCGKETLSMQNAKSLVQLLQHMQLFMELLAIKKLSAQNRWRLVLLIELIKMFCRLYLLFCFDGHMLIMQNEAELKFNERLRQAQNNDSAFPELQRVYVEHGRGADPNGFWSPSSKAQQSMVDNSALMAHVTLSRVKYPEKKGRALKRTVFAEALFMMRPVVEVMAQMRWGGSASWTPFVLALVMDVFSQMAHLTSAIVTKRQRAELARRRRYWLLYLLRPPFFGRYIESTLKAKGKRLKERDSTVRYWVLMMFTNLLCQFQNNHFNISGSNY